MQSVLSSDSATFEPVNQNESVHLLVSFFVEQNRRSHFFTHKNSIRITVNTAPSQFLSSKLYWHVCKFIKIIVFDGNSIKLVVE
jgi:hypothetical protein